MCTAIVCERGYDVTHSEINLIFLIKPFFRMMKKSRQKLNILRTKRAFGETKSIFQKGFSVAKIVSDLRPLKPVCFHKVSPRINRKSGNCSW